MIVQFDHLTLSSPNLEAHRRLLESLGYRERFFAHDVPNLQIKKPLVSRFQPFHDLLFLDAPDVLSIEIINQGDRERVHSPIVPIFENLPSSPVSSDMPVRMGSRNVREMILDGLDVPIYIPIEKSPKDLLGFRSLVMRTPDIDTNVRLWEALGCERMSSSDDSVHLAFTSPLHKEPVDLFLVKDEGSHYYKLDTYGFNYCALVSTSPKKDRDALTELGFKVTPLETATINNRTLDFFFVTGSGVLPVEIFGIHS